MKVNTKRLHALIISSAFLFASTNGMAADGKTLYASKTCIACHGADANTPMLPNYPKLAGQNKEYLVQQMKDIKSGDRSNGQSATMKAVMAMVNDEEINILAEYLAGLK